MVSATSIATTAGVCSCTSTVVQLLREWEDRAARRNALPPFEPHVWYLACREGLPVMFKGSRLACSAPTYRPWTSGAGS